MFFTSSPLVSTKSGADVSNSPRERRCACFLGIIGSTPPQGFIEFNTPCMLRCLTDQHRCCQWVLGTVPNASRVRQTLGVFREPSWFSTRVFASCTEKSENWFKVVCSVLVIHIHRRSENYHFVIAIALLEILSIEVALKKKYICTVSASSLRSIIHPPLQALPDFSNRILVSAICHQVCVVNIFISPPLQKFNGIARSSMEQSRC